MKKALKTAARGTVFPYAGEKWVVLEHDPAGRTLCLRLDLIPNKPFDENNCNNFATSSSTTVPVYVGLKCRDPGRVSWLDLTCSPVQARTCTAPYCSVFSRCSRCGDGQVV